MQRRVESIVDLAAMSVSHMTTISIKTKTYSFPIPLSRYQRTAT